MGRVLLSVILLVGFVNCAVAVPKSKPCKLFKIDNCIPKSQIKKSLRDQLPANSKFVTPLQAYPVLQGTLTGFPEQTTVTPQVLIPAGTRSIQVCRISVGGKLECTLLTAFNDCPHNVTMYDESSSRSYSCDVDCDNRRPNGDADENGNCDCDIDYGSCQPIG